MFFLEDWPMPSYAYQRGIIVFKETDVDFSGRTDSEDLAGFSDYWLWYDVRDPNNFETYDDYLDFWDPNNLDPDTLDFTGVYFDFNEDGHVDFGDLGFLSRDWLDVADNFPSNISVEFDGDPNYLDGAVDYGIQGFRDTTKEIYVLLNSKVIDIITVDEMNVSMGVLSHSMDSTKYANNDPNEMHELCFVGVDSFGSPEVSDSFDIGFNNLLSNNLSQDHYTASGYFISGTYAGSKSLSVTVSRNGSAVYSRILAASSVINAHIPNCTV